MNLTLIDWLLLAVFVGWWTISLFGQLKQPQVSAIKSKDLLHLIPSWRFFAPVPVRRDFHIEYRLRAQNSDLTRWMRIPLSAEKDFLCALWNPGKRLRKAFSTSVRRLTGTLRQNGYYAAATSLAYLHLLYYVQHITANTEGRALQFRIISCQDLAHDQHVRLIFTSSWHAQPVSGSDS
jgi:hypothetical protein